MTWHRPWKPYKYSSLFPHLRPWKESERISKTHTSPPRPALDALVWRNTSKYTQHLWSLQHPTQDKRQQAEKGREGTMDVVWPRVERTRTSLQTVGLSNPSQIHQPSLPMGVCRGFGAACYSTRLWQRENISSEPHTGRTSTGRSRGRKL